MENPQRKKRKLSKTIKSSVRENLYVPVDLLFDIFSRVPSKSIARFRCLSKIWRSILRRSDFTELFLTRSSTHPRILFHFIHNKELFSFSSPQPRIPYENCSIVATRYNKPFPELANVWCNGDMVYGLVFLQGFWSRNSCKICNYATGELLSLPKLETKTNHTPNVHHFGYDPINKQFKVLCMTSSNTHCWILTLETGTLLWRRIKWDFPFCASSLRHRNIYINGVLYFEAESETSYMIVCFDVRSEKFSFVNRDIDEIVIKFLCPPSVLINYNGKFGIRRSRDHPRTLDFDLWVLEDAENHKWSKHIYEFPPFWNEIVKENELRIVGMTDTGEIVFAPYRLLNPFYVFYYNFEKNTFTKVNVQGFEECTSKRIEIYTYLDYVENVELFN